MAIEATVWVPGNTEDEYVLVGNLNVLDPSGNSLLDPSGTNVVTPTNSVTPIPKTTWTYTENA